MKGKGYNKSLKNYYNRDDMLSLQAMSNLHTYYPALSEDFTDNRLNIIRKNNYRVSTDCRIRSILKMKYKKRSLTLEEMYRYTT